MSDSESNPAVPLGELDVRQAAWPTALGFVSIIYAIIAFFANVASMAAPFLEPVGLRLGGVTIDPDMGLPGWIIAGTLVFGFVGVLLAIFLVVGAVGLIRRTPSGVALLKIWSVLAASAAVLAIGFGSFAIEPNTDRQLEIQSAFQDLIREQHPSDADQRIANVGLDQDRDSMKKASIRNLAIFGSMPLLFPLLLGIFLTGKRREQEIRAWE